MLLSVHSRQRTVRSNLLNVSEFCYPVMAIYQLVACMLPEASACILQLRLHRQLKRLPDRRAGWQPRSSHARLAPVWREKGEHSFSIDTGDIHDCHYSGRRGNCFKANSRCTHDWQSWADDAVAPSLSLSGIPSFPLTPQETPPRSFPKITLVMTTTAAPPCLFLILPRSLPHILLRLRMSISTFLVDIDCHVSDLAVPQWGHCVSAHLLSSSRASRLSGSLSRLLHYPH